MLLKKQTTWRWGAGQQAAMDEIKRQLTTAPVLLIPDPKLPFTLVADARDQALGAVLLQDQGKGL